MNHSAIKLTGSPNSGPVAATRQRDQLTRLPGCLFALINYHDFSVTAYFGNCSVEQLQSMPALPVPVTAEA